MDPDVIDLSQGTMLAYASTLAGRQSARASARSTGAGGALARPRILRTWDEKVFRRTAVTTSGTDRYRAPIFVIVTMDIGTVADFCHRYLCPA
jgi:hypothetical protein